MLTKQQLMIMLTLQDRMNSTVNPSWILMAHNWLLAAALELAEAIEHYGWKWWKKQEPNIKMVQGEIVDYVHFIFSHELVLSGGDKHTVADAWIRALNKEKSAFYANYSSLDVLQKMMHHAVANMPCLDLLDTCLNHLGMTWNDLFNQYVAKNALNMFRQKHGYKEGTYIKTWYDGQEDNCHMIEIMETIPMDYDDIDECMSIITQELSERYARTLSESNEEYAL